MGYVDSMVVIRSLHDSWTIIALNIPPWGILDIEPVEQRLMIQSKVLVEFATSSSQEQLTALPQGLGEVGINTSDTTVPLIKHQR